MLSFNHRHSHFYSSVHACKPTGLQPGTYRLQPQSAERTSTRGCPDIFRLGATIRTERQRGARKPALRDSVLGIRCWWIRLCRIALRSHQDSRGHPGDDPGSPGTGQPAQQAQGQTLGCEKGAPGRPGTGRGLSWQRPSRPVFVLSSLDDSMWSPSIPGRVPPRWSTSRRQSQATKSPPARIGPTCTSLGLLGFPPAVMRRSRRPTADPSTTEGRRRAGQATRGREKTHHHSSQPPEEAQCVRKLSLSLPSFRSPRKSNFSLSCEY